ncbi:MAG: site-2 protease family protein [Desulfurococcaceae archaeon TW002]
MSYLVYRNRSFYFRVKSEVLDFLISWVVLSFSFALFMRSGLDKLLLSLAYSSVGVGSAFILHELAHRQVARAYGLEARYRAWYLGLLITLAVALINAAVRLPVLFAAPGAVVIYRYWGRVDSVAELRVAESGPLTNIAVGIAAWIAFLAMSPTLVFTEVLYYIMRINVWIAFFNLLPIPPLDGSKIIRRSLIEWVIIFIISVVTLKLLT